MAACFSLAAFAAEADAANGRFRHRARRVVQIVTHPVKAAKAVKVVGDWLKKAERCFGGNCHKN